MDVAEILVFLELHLVEEVGCCDPDTQSVLEERFLNTQVQCLIGFQLNVALCAASVVIVIGVDEPRMGQAEILVADEVELGLAIAVRLVHVFVIEEHVLHA